MASFATLVNEQSIVHIPAFTLESGSVLRDVPVAFKTWGKLNDTRDNVMVICHAFTGSADVEDWWVHFLNRAYTLQFNIYSVLKR